MTREQTSDTFDVRLDHRFTDNRSLYVRYSDNGVDDRWCPACSGSSTASTRAARRPGSAAPRCADAWGLHGNYLEIIKPTLLFEAKVGKLFFNTESLPETYGQNIATLVRAAGHQRRRPDVGPAELHRGRLHDARRPALRADPAEERHLAGAGRADQRPRRPQPARRRRHRAPAMAPIQSNDGPGLYAFTATPTNNGAGGGGDAAAAFLLGYPFPCRGRTWSSTPPWRRGSRASSCRTTGARKEWLTLNLGAALRHLHAVHRRGRRDSRTSTSTRSSS